MSDRALSGKERYRARFLAELDGRIEAILTSATTLREAGLPTIPNDDSAQAIALVNAVDQLYRHAHSIRGAAGTLGIEPAREAADLLAEIALHLNEEGILGDTLGWDLISRAADGLAVFGAACRGGHDPEATALAEALPLLRADYERRFTPPEDAVDDFAEVARVLRLSCRRSCRPRRRCVRTRLSSPSRRTLTSLSVNPFPLRRRSPTPRS